MVRVLDSRLRGRGFDSQLFWFQVSVLETLYIFKADLKILRMCQIPANRMSTNTILSFTFDGRYCCCINLRPFCTGHPQSDCARTERQSCVRKLRSRSPCASDIVVYERPFALYAFVQVYERSQCWRQRSPLLHPGRLSVCLSVSACSKWNAINTKVSRASPLQALSMHRLWGQKVRDGWAARVCMSIRLHIL